MRLSACAMQVQEEPGSEGAAQVERQSRDQRALRRLGDRARIRGRCAGLETQPGSEDAAQVQRHSQDQRELRKFGDGARISDLGSQPDPNSKPDPQANPKPQ
eukprot:357286-Chlamydomonas_euryale.AAC.12